MLELCLKDNPVMSLEEDAYSKPTKIIKVINPELLPVGLPKTLTIEDFIGWLKKRSIPPEREGLEEFRARFGDKYLENYRYLSLSDHYWLKRREKSWKSVNFFTKRYSPSLGDIFFHPWTFQGKKIESNSPELTTSGISKKRWIQDQNLNSHLIKAASVASKQEPLSEVLASVLIERLEIPGLTSAGYDLHIEGATMCSRCKNFVTPDTELVLASQIYSLEEKRNEDDVYTHLIRMCEAQDIPNAKDFIDNLIFVDKLISNKDRHLGNIGFLRNVNTLKYVGPAPVFDCGASYWSNKKQENVSPPLFLDREDSIVKEKLKELNLSVVLKMNDYVEMISNYPCIDDYRKNELISNIKNQNNRILNADAPNLGFER